MKDVRSSLTTLGAGRFDYLVNNAGTSLHRRFEQTTVEQLRHNPRAPVVQAVDKSMKSKDGRPSFAAHNPTPYAVKTETGQSSPCRLWTGGGVGRDEKSSVALLGMTVPHHSSTALPLTMRA